MPETMPISYLVTIDTPNGPGQLEVPSMLGTAIVARRAMLTALSLGWGEPHELTITNIEESARNKVVVVSDPNVPLQAVDHTLAEGDHHQVCQQCGITNKLIGDNGLCGPCRRAADEVDA